MPESFTLDAAGVISRNDRVGFSETYNCLMQTSRRLGLPIVSRGTPYWEQGITLAIEDALELGTKYLIFFDGDSVWLDEDLVELYKLIDANPHVDAIVPIQADRNGPKPLAFDWQPIPITYDHSTPTTPIIHGHFGLTIIRTSVFRTVPQPWFQSIPGQGGSWRPVPGKKDSDTYFWIKLHEHGKQVVAANHTVVGHMELHIRWQVGAKVYAQTLAEYHQHGPPYGRRAPWVSELPQGAKTSSEAAYAAEAAKKATPVKKPGMSPDDEIKPDDDGLERAIAEIKAHSEWKEKQAEATEAGEKAEVANA